MTYFLDFQGTLIDAGEQAPVYQDVPEFLRMLGNEAIIITKAPASARAEIEKRLDGIVRLTILCTDFRPKAEFLASWAGYHGGPAIFVDDNPSELAELLARFPALKLYEMRRDGAAGDGRWPVVRSLSELP